MVSKDFTKIYISTFPFCETNRFPMEMLVGNGCKFTVNPLGRKMTEDELIGALGESEALVAGTETISSRVFDKCPKLRHISRVGVGLDSVNILEAKKRGISVSYTPEAPAPAVAELTIGLMISLLRKTDQANLLMHQGQWQRFMGRRISEVTLGVLGVGRIGGRVLRRLRGFGTPRVLVNDLLADQSLNKAIPELKLEWVEKEIIYREADLITLHLPLTPRTKNLIGSRELAMFKKDSLLINTSRGGIVNESALWEALHLGPLAAAAVDVFEKEPYSGPLSNLPNCLLTSHMGSMSQDCRTRMEVEATEEAIRFVLGKPLFSPVPAEEYENASCA
jgi:D-3-phosphoglycerate dehydrogenase